MQVRLLGTAAGGGFPQWNCNCANCSGMRRGTVVAESRTQSSVTLSGDGTRWFLLNASPDVREQIRSFPSLLPPEDRKRGTPLEGVLLTNADLDHTLGLFILREGRPLTVHAPALVREALTEGLPVDSVLEHYSGTQWVEPPTELEPLLLADGSPSGLSYSAIPVPGKAPRYFMGRDGSREGHTVAYRFVDDSTGGRMIYAPGIAELGEGLLARLGACDLLLVDGTFFTEDEMERSGVGTLRAHQMGHVPVGGKGGTLELLSSLPPRHKVYVHINNTNPMLVEGSPEHRGVLRAGLEVGRDGMEFTL